MSQLFGTVEDFIVDIGPYRQICKICSKDYHWSLMLKYEIWIEYSSYTQRRKLVFLLMLCMWHQYSCIFHKLKEELIYMSDMRHITEPYIFFVYDISKQVCNIRKYVCGTCRKNMYATYGCNIYTYWFQTCAYQWYVSAAHVMSINMGRFV